MKKTLRGLAALITVAAPMAMAQLPFSNSFEVMDYPGQSIFSNPVAYATWSGTGVAMLTNVISSNSLNTPFMGYPLGTETHTGVLYFAETPLTNSVTSPGNGLVGIDTMVQPTFMQELVPNASVSNSNVSIAFTTNGQLAVYHGTFSDGKTGPAPDGKQWTIFTGLPTVSSGKWVRVSVDVNYNAVDQWGSTTVMFKIKLDGVEASAPIGYPSPDTTTGPTGGPWLIAASLSYNMSRVVLEGSGMMDDLSINSAAVGNYITSTHRIPYGWLQSMGVTNDSSEAAMEAADSSTADADGDGMLNWQEYIAGTHPTNAASKLVIVSEIMTNGVPRLRWLSSQYALAPYRIDSTTNLLLGTSGWTNEVSGLTADASGTNQYDMATSTPKFYRITIVK